MNKDDIYEIEIEMTTLCNAQCPLCFRNYKVFNDKYKIPYVRKLEDITYQLDQFNNLKYVMIVGSMSEPTLYPYIFLFIKYLKSRNIDIEICTNGDTHDVQFWKNLALILSDTDKVYFTICGSTQKIHEHYRKNTNLQNILKNAYALRSIRQIDYAQCIRFNYNSDDFDSQSFKHIVSQFSNVYWTETFFPKNLSAYNVKFNYFDFLPFKHKYKKYNNIKYLAETKFIHNKDVALCQSIEFKRIQIDVFGNIYPCYLFLEYLNGQIWDYDFSKIFSMQYECCKFCQKSIKKLCQMYKLDYII